MASSEFRRSGNDFYRKAMLEGLAPVLRLFRLQSALEKYKEAAAVASDPEDWSSATKNCGVANMRIAQVYMEEPGGDGVEKALLAFRESLTWMSRALLRGAPVRCLEWGVSLQDEMMACYSDVLALASGLTDSKLKLRELYKVAGILADSLVLAKIKYDTADLLFKESVRLLENNDYKECLRCLHDIHQPVEEALGILKGGNLLPCSEIQEEDLVADIHVLKQDSHYHICSAESMQARKIGEAYLVELLTELEFARMDKVLNVMDWFKQASLKAAELDLEQEAAALSYLGLMHEKFLLSRTKSKAYFKKCLELVEAAKPRIFTSHQWYKQCVEGFKKIQDQERQRDEAEQQKMKESILETMKDDIQALKKANTSASSLMEHVLKHHPCPVKDRTSNFTKTQLAELSKTEAGKSSPGQAGLTTRKTRKKLLLEALRDYHPDKIVEKAEGETDEAMEKRKVLVEEICKMITRYYEEIKLAS